MGTPATDARGRSTRCDCGVLRAEGGRGQRTSKQLKCIVREYRPHTRIVPCMPVQAPTLQIVVLHPAASCPRQALCPSAPVCPLGLDAPFKSYILRPTGLANPPFPYPLCSPMHQHVELHPIAAGSSRALCHLHQQRASPQTQQLNCIFSLM